MNNEIELQSSRSLNWICLSGGETSGKTHIAGLIKLRNRNPLLIAAKQIWLERQKWLRKSQRARFEPKT